MGPDSGQASTQGEDVMVAGIALVATRTVCSCSVDRSRRGWLAGIKSASPAVRRTIAGAGLHGATNTGSKDPRRQVCTDACRAKHSRVKSGQATFSLEGRGSDWRKAKEKSERSCVATSESASRSPRRELRIRHQIFAERAGHAT